MENKKMNCILIIEDDTDINNMTAEALTKAGYVCRQAFSGTEGLLYVEREEFSLILMDLMLPGLSGGRVAAKDTGKVQFTGDCAFCQKQFRQQSEFIDFGCRGLCDKAF